MSCLAAAETFLQRLAPPLFASPRLLDIHTMTLVQRSGVSERVIDRWSDSLVKRPRRLCRSSVGSLFVLDARLYTTPPPSGGTYTSRGTSLSLAVQSHELTGGPQERREARRRREARKPRTRGFASKKIDLGLRAAWLTVAQLARL